MSKTITKKIHTDKFLTVFFVDINNIKEYLKSTYNLNG